MRKMNSKILTKEWQPETVASKTHAELYPKLHEDMTKSCLNILIIILNKNTKDFLHVEDVSKKTTYTQAQTRSADEPMTTFVTCLDCNHRWKFS